MLKAIVFDFDGVIADSEPLHYRAFRCAAESLGITLDYDDYVDQLIGYDDRDALRVLLARTGGAADASRLSLLIEEKARAFERMARDGGAPIPGVLDFVAEVAVQMPIAISSGAARADIDLILEGLGLAGSFDPIISADDVRRSKPDPQCYKLAVEGLAERHPQLALRPDDCLAIEDTPAGIASARAAGLWTLGLTTSLPAENLQAAHRVTSSFAGLSLERLMQWFK